jgi:hypothetical protein
MNDLREQLAALQHEIWAHWMNYLFSVSQEEQDGAYRIPVEQAQRWIKQVNTSYVELSDLEKESDREQADKVLDLLNHSHHENEED